MIQWFKSISLSGRGSRFRMRELKLSKKTTVVASFAAAQAELWTWRGNVALLGPRSLSEQVRNLIRKLKRSPPTPIGQRDKRTSLHGVLAERTTQAREQGRSWEPVDPRRQIFKVLTGRLDDLDHGTATSVLQEICSSTDFMVTQDSRELFQLARLTRSVGLFTAASSFDALAYSRLRKEISQLNGARKYTNEIRLAVAIRDLDLAMRSAQKLRRHLVGHWIPEARDLLGYVDLWSGRVDVIHEDLRRSKDRSFRQLISRNGVLLIGPGPTDARLTSSVDGWLTARILTRRDNQWDQKGDVARNRTNIVYVNGDTGDWLASISGSVASEMLKHYQAVNFKSMRHSLHFKGHDVSAARHSKSPVFVEGSPNMVPLMTMDLLVSGASVLYLSGVTFYLSDMPYRDPHGDVKGRNFSVDYERFHFCKGIGGHSPHINRHFLQNLVGRKCLTGDKNFIHSVNMSTAECDAEYDRLYGIPAI